MFGLKQRLILMTPLMIMIKKCYVFTWLVPFSQIPQSKYLSQYINKTFNKKKDSLTETFSTCRGAALIGATQIRQHCFRLGYNTSASRCTIPQYMHKQRNNIKVTYVVYKGLAQHLHIQLLCTSIWPSLQLILLTVHNCTR